MFQPRWELEAFAGSLNGAIASVGGSPPSAWADREHEMRRRSLNCTPATKPEAGSATGGGRIKGNLRREVTTRDIIREFLADGALSGSVPRKMVWHSNTLCPGGQRTRGYAAAGDPPYPM